ncbi:unnamed protein product [Bursaphelenchus xylophilus]|uniref:(pine wood nematode) hypothetical protein n=1 Tax=Bursaphelenchus xylophilus TaxID=6326 RepID=A0A1I7RNY1_BURXY|nr:unnamed protein product [Bursaphelenchus xylophilus]CAG9124380.1 unnamed protein product [Bursaphelenchus xylophilus]
MSGSLPDADKGYVQGRLEMLERRLERAKDLRENYLEEMKAQHPEVYNARSRLEAEEVERRSAQRVPKMSSESQEILDESINLFQNRPSLMRRLETAQYFWNDQQKDELYQKKALPVNDPIPSGLVLNSDMKNLQGRLKKIGDEIRGLREYRLSATTSDYLGTINPSSFDSNTSPELPSLVEIRHRILQMDTNIEKRAREMLTKANLQRHLMRKQANQTSDIVLEDPMKFLTEKLGFMARVQEDHKVTVTEKDGDKVQSQNNPESVNNERDRTEIREPKEEKNDELQPQIAPSRNLVFGDQLKKASEASSYSKMLSILKAPQSNDTSEDEDQLPSKSDNKPFISQVAQPTRPTFQPPPFPVQEPPKKITLKDQDFDSDSDFFR